MTTRSRDPKGDIRHNSTPVRPESHGAQDEAHRQVNTQRDMLSPDGNLQRLLEQIVNWDHGYFKLRRSSTGGDLHLTWTWTLGTHAGSYVYVRVMYWELAFGLQLLAEKVFKADEGKLTPTVDKRGSRHYSA